MKNLALAKKLEGCTVSLPSDYMGKILALDFSPNVRDYAKGVAHNMDGMNAVTSASGKLLNAMHVAAICITTIVKMMEAQFSKTEVLAAYTITPEYLAIMIPDEFVRHDAITLFNEEMTELISNYVQGQQ